MCAFDLVCMVKIKLVSLQMQSHLLEIATKFHPNFVPSRPKVLMSMVDFLQGEQVKTLQINREEVVKLEFQNNNHYLRPHKYNNKELKFLL
jgi:hypothetical protein